jgi:hypothetical protein
MPRNSETLELPTDPSATHDIARRLVVERGWSVEAVTAGRLVARRAMRASTWPITVEFSFAAADRGTSVTLDGKIGGWGPLQRKALVRAMDELRASLEFEATRPATDADVTLR